MSSTLGCLGLYVDDLDTLDALVGRLLPEATVIAESGELQARRWIDPTGASLTMTIQKSGDDSGVLIDLVPSYVDATGAAGVRVGALVGHGSTLAADLVDEDGETLTRLACDLAQSLTAELDEPREATITALALDVRVHADAAAFEASDDSILGDSAPGETELRFATDSLMSYGLFGDPETAEPTAFLAGTVLSVVTHPRTELDQGFHAAQVRTVGGTLTVCLAADEHPQAPQPGNVLAGIHYLVLDVPTLW